VGRAHGKRVVRCWSGCTSTLWARRSKLLGGLLAMYRDNEVAQYYDAALLTNYGRRYWLFTGVIVCLAATGIVVPLIIRMS
jgi:hypothetical protein